MAELTWRCRCEAVEAHLPRQGNRIVCYCKSCRSFVEQFGKAERLQAAGGSDLLQVEPQRVRISKGVEHLRWTQLTSKGPFRWYASCCGTPMANTLPTRAVAFASFQVHDIVETAALPDVRARVHLNGALAHVEPPHGSIRPLVFGLLRNTVKAWIDGGWRRHPFFNAAGKPVGPREDPAPSTG